MPRPPKEFEGFVGQRRIIKGVERLVTGALQLGLPVIHMLLSGPPGFGKTSLARAVVRAYGTKLVQLSAPKLSSKVLASALHSLTYGDFLFIDEAHLLGDNVTETLNLALVDYLAPDPEQDDPTKLGNIAKFTLILATNRPGRLSKALKTRLHEFLFDDYRDDELVEIARRAARSFKLDLTPQGARRIAQASAGSPRTIEQRVELLRAWHSEPARIDQSMVESFLGPEGPLGLDVHGLDANQRRYLRFLAVEPALPMTQQSLKHALGCDLGSVRQDVEPALFQRRLIEALSGGRRITSKGLALIKGATP